MPKIDWTEDSYQPEVLDHVDPVDCWVGDLVQDLDTNRVYCLRFHDRKREFYEITHQRGFWARLKGWWGSILFGPRRLVCHKGGRYVLMGTANRDGPFTVEMDGGV